MKTLECRLCHRIGTREFAPVGAEGWECGNDRACKRRAERRKRETEVEQLRALVSDLIEAVDRHDFLGARAFRIRLADIEPISR